MIAIVSLLLVLVLSLIITRAASVALTYTGLSPQAARFQARSAFTGVGFTTSESEKIVNHPVRRKILMLIMLIGNAGIVATISTLILGFVQTGGSSSLFFRLLLLITGIIVLMLLSMSRWVEHRLEKWIELALKKYTNLDVKDYASILHLSGEYAIHELYVQEKDWLSDKLLQELRLPDEGVLVLGISHKNGSFTGTPNKNTKIKESDTLILYGRESNIRRLDERGQGPGGNIQHAEAVVEQQAVSAMEGKE